MCIAAIVYLRQLSSLISEPWLALDDFNATLSTEECVGCASLSRPYQDFIAAVFDTELHDIVFQGPTCTWYRANCAVRLGRCFCNVHWLEASPNSIVHHLIRMKSDHRPLLVSLGRSFSHSKQPEFYIDTKTLAA
ncbi:hypothetical protein V6N13_062665 [Hibiscus sabdariffa]|uniref:Endonuclease/exonuclease/phosphatase domain-containing protein n=2 Tax=Hibiscus sabdariffa TaxID=183260 RepID=A0ABR2BB23_9ROSI